MGVSVGSGSIKSDPNVVPFCDVLLVLLIIFMVLTPTAQQGTDVKLPEVQSQKEAEQNPVKSSIPMLVVKKDTSKPGGFDITLNNQPLTYNDLLETLRMKLSTRVDRRIFLRVGPKVKYQVVVDLIDKCKEAGAEAVALVPIPAE